MRVAILGGTGAMGSAVGACLADGGHDVTLVDVDAAAVAAIATRGVTVEKKDGSSRTVRVGASADPAAVGPVEALLVFVKCYHTEAAVLGARPMIGPETAVLSLQNGWGNGPRIASLLGEENLFVGVTYHSATRLAPGRVLHAGIGPTYLGRLDGAPSERAVALASALASPDFDVDASGDVLERIWGKLLLNVCTLPTSALLGFGSCQLVEHDGTLGLMRSILEEAVAVAHAKGVPVDLEERWTAITGLLGRVGRSKSSMLQDVEAGRRTEIEVINGAIVAAGTETGVPTPVNAAMMRLIQAKQEAYAA